LYSYQKFFTGQRLALCIASVWIVPAILYLPVVIGKFSRILCCINFWNLFFICSTV